MEDTVIRVCAACGAVGKHYARGLCRRCYKNKHRNLARKLNPEVFRARDRAHRETYGDRIRAANRKYLRKNNTKQAAYKREFRRCNPEYAAAERAGRRHSVRQATPRWLTKKHRQEIAQVYLARINLQIASGVPMHVDHIVPIKGTNVCGLHVPWNLAVITQSENCRKYNKHE